MILEYSAKNFMSIKDIVTFSFKASKIDEKNEVITEVNSNMVLTSGVIYGANASGKTNILNVVGYIKQILDLSTRISAGDKLPFYPFRLNDETVKSPTEIQIVFFVKQIKYTYGFSLTLNQIESEYLYYYPNGRKNIIFERNNTNDYNFTNDKGELQTLANRTLDNRLFLAVASEWKYHKCLAPFEWLRNGIVVNTHLETTNWFEYSATQIIENTKLSNQISDFIKIADPNIIGLAGVKEDFSVSELPNNSPSELKGMLLYKKAKTITINSSHRGKNKNGDLTKVDFSFQDESAGTQRFFELLGPVVDIIEKGKVLIIDELDIKLHTKLTKLLVSLFQNKKFNTNNAQLLFTTHDTNLLDLEIFRRDQIWFTEKCTDDASTSIYSLIEIKNIRKDENTQKGYLFGKYGALPKDSSEILSRWY